MKQDLEKYSLTQQNVNINTYNHKLYNSINILFQIKEEKDENIKLSSRQNHIVRDHIRPKHTHNI